MASTINYNQKQVELLPVQLEIEDTGKCIIKGSSEKGAAEYLSIHTDITGITKIVTLKSGKIEYKVKDYSATLCYDTIRAFLEAHSVNVVCEPQEYKEALETILTSFVMPMEEPEYDVAPEDEE